MKQVKSQNNIDKKDACDLERLTLWKYSSTKAKLNWLESAYYFGKLKKFRKAS
jgi:hypothetical protein